MQRRSAKWWMPLFSWTVDVAAVNSFAVWKSEVPSAARKGRAGERATFQKALVRGLLGVDRGGVNEAKLEGQTRTASTLKRTAGAAGFECAVVQSGAPLEFFEHFNLEEAAKRRNCVVCSPDSDGVRHQTKFRCAHKSCLVYLHPGCSYTYHCKRFKPAAD